MHLIYLDESGNSGTNLRDPGQPLFVLAALIVPEDVWAALESDLKKAADEFFPEPRPDRFEIHATEIRNGNGYFRQFSVEHRLAFRDACLDIASRYELRLIYRAIEKIRFARWIEQTLGSGIRINPHIAAFPLVARVADEYLQSLPGNTRGIFISDELREIIPDVEKAIFLLHGAEGTLRLNRIVEKGFFIDSTKSRVLQLCDLCAYHVKKLEERKLGLAAKAIDDGGISRIVPLIHRGNEALQDTLQWIIDQQKKGAARG